MSLPPMISSRFSLSIRADVQTVDQPRNSSLPKKGSPIVFACTATAKIRTPVSSCELLSTSTRTPGGNDGRWST